MPERNRLHLDVTGSRPVDLGQGDDADGVALVDPEGNEFGVLRERRP